MKRTPSALNGATPARRALRAATTTKRKGKIVVPLDWDDAFWRKSNAFAKSKGLTLDQLVEQLIAEESRKRVSAEKGRKTITLSFAADEWAAIKSAMDKHAPGLPVEYLIEAETVRDFADWNEPFPESEIILFHVTTGLQRALSRKGGKQ